MEVAILFNVVEHMFQHLGSNSSFPVWGEASQCHYVEPPGTFKDVNPAANSSHHNIIVVCCVFKGYKLISNQ